MADQKIALYRRLNTKFIAMAFILFLLPQIFLYFYTSNSASNMLVESLRNGLKEKSFLVGADIDRFFNQRLHDVRVLSQADVFEADDTNAIIRYLTEVISETPYLDDIDVISTQGIIIASSGAQNEQGRHVLSLHPSLRNIFDNVLNAQQGDLYVSDVLTLDSGPGLAFLSPITDESNTVVIKVLLVEINLDTVKKIVSDFDDRVIGNKFVYLVNNDGRVIVSADPESSLLSLFPDLRVNPKLLENFSHQGDVGSTIYTDSKGDLVIAGFADMAEFGVNMAMDWSIIAVAPMADIIKPVTHFSRALLLFSASIFGVVLLVMFLFSRNIVGSLQRLLEGARKVGEGDLQFRIRSDTADEFGFLARTINQTLDRLVTAQQTAETATLSKSEFLAAMSHEIRTPMSGIIGMVDLMLVSNLSIQQKDWATSIRTSSQHLMKILNEILDQSKLEAGMISLDPVDFHLASFVHHLTDLFLPKIASKKLFLDVKISEALPAGIKADSFRIGQILSNLLSNAFKFTDSGSITVRVTPEPVEGDGLLIRFSITDSGIGIEQEAQTELFTSFTQADRSTSRTYGGTGLGLSISKHLAVLMGGEIGVNSQIGVGSTFWFTVLALPVDGEVKPSDKSAHSTRWEASRSLKVLIAEDTEVIQELIAAIFEQLNHEAKIVKNGKIAVKHIGAEDFDIVLMDIRMPIMDGLEATAIIRAMDGEKAKIPIIALTADITAGNIKQFKAIGIDAICPKPIELPNLLETIDDLLGEKIHTSIPQESPAAQDQQATNSEADVASVTRYANLAQVLEGVSDMVDHPSSSDNESAPFILKMAGMDSARAANMLAKYEERLIENCYKLKTEMDALAASSADDGLRNKMSMLIHAMKGGGRTYGYPLITTIASNADALLNAKNSLEAEDLCTLGNYVDALSLVARKRISGDGGEAGRVLLQGLKENSKNVEVRNE